jgi:hypothetical protein
MARPKPIVRLAQEVGDGSLWEVLEADLYYVITYKGDPVNIRITQGSLTGNNHIYKKLTYTSLGSANLQARRLNYRFKCQDFEVMEVGK